MKKIYVLILTGALKGQVGLLTDKKKENKKKVEIDEAAFFFTDHDYRYATFEEIFDKFVKGRRIMSNMLGKGMDQNPIVIQGFDNGWSMRTYTDRMVLVDPGLTEITEELFRVRIRNRRKKAKATHP